MKKIIKCTLCFVVAISTFFSGYSLSAKESEQLINVAPRGEAYASQVTTDNNNSGPEHINDDVIALNSFWDSGKKETDDVYIVLDLKREYDIREIRLFNYWGPIYGTQNERWYKYEIYSSVDNEQWELVGKKDTEEFVKEEGDLYQLETPKIARYIKVKCIDSNIDNDITHIVELQVFAPAEETDVNIALNKPVNAAQGNAFNITNGSKSDYWDGGVGPQSFVIDLEDYYEISTLHAYPYFGDGRYYHYEIYISDNGYTWNMVAQKSDNTPETAKGTLFEINSDEVARYVRVNMTYNSANSSVHMNEFEVYGIKQEGYVPPIPVDPDDIDNIAFAKETRANTGKNISNWAVDGNLDTSWSTFTFPANLDVDLGKNYNLSDLTVYFPVSKDRYYQYTVYTSIDGINFDRLVQKRNHDIVDDDGDTYLLDNQEARYIRINVEFVSQGVAAYLSEIKVHGSESQNPTIERKELEIPSFEDSQYAKAITPEETIDEVYALVERRLGNQYKEWFDFELVESENDEDFFEISNNGGKILIRGNEGVSLTTGLNYYLKYYCKVQITQQTEQLNTLPDKVIPVTEKIYKSTPLTVRYAYNYCTLSYTNAFYGEEEWQRELDWLALNGVNVVLDTTGQEAVWVDFLQKLGYTTEDAKAWLVGPAYTAWQFMSNMENYGGPINDQYILDRLELARKNQRKMRVLGMIPVLQGYSGMIPSDYENVVDDKEKYKDIINAMMPQGIWGGQCIRPDMLKTNTEVFDKCAEMFYESQEKVLGDISSYYATDPFHEGGIPPQDMTSEEISATVLKKMMEHDSDAVWMIQSWFENPTKGLLDGLGEYREDHALILDLSATTDPRYNNSNWGDEFYGTSWIYCMLDNFGDRPGVHGELEVIASQVAKARETSQHMKGIGITPEGTKLNPVNYELFFETVWEDEAINVEEWLKNYVERRYGSYSESAYQGWLKLLDTAYGATGGHWGSTNSIANYRPGMSLILGDNRNIPYNTRLFNLGVEQILTDYDKLSTSESYLYDVASLLQQQLQNSQLTYYNNFEKAYKEDDLEEFDKNTKLFINSISVVDEITATQEDGLLGNWIGKAHDRSKNYDDFSKDIFDFNAKSLITTWGGRTCAKTLGDYAYRQYSGLENDYVKPRWEKYIESKREVLVNGTEYKEITYDEYFNDMWDFILSNKIYSRETTDARSELKRLSQIVAENYLVDSEKEVSDDNIAINGFPSSDHGTTGGYTLGQGIDDNDSTLWVAGSAEVPSTFELDLANDFPVYKIQVAFEKEPALNRNLFIGFKVEGYIGNDWIQVLEDKTSVNQQTFDILFNTPKDMSKVRVVITSVDGTLRPAIAELRVYSSKGIQILDNTSLEIKDDKLILNQVDTVANIKSKLYADVGDIKFFKDSKEMSDNDLVTANCEIKLIISNIVVDTLKTEVQTSNVDKTALKIAVDLANAITDKDLENVVPVVVEEFKVARDEANAIYNDTSATQVEVNNAFDRLASVMQKLEFFKGDKTALKTFIDKVTGLDANKYTQATWASFNDALTAANSVYNDLNAMQEEVNDAYTNLVTAFLNLRLIPDKSLLEELINQVYGLNAANYTKATFDGLTKALDEAKVVFDNPNASQVEVDNAKDVLAKALAGLQTVTTDNTVNTPVNNSDTTVSVKTGDESLVGMFATIALLSVAGYTVLRRKDD